MSHRGAPPAPGEPYEVQKNRIEPRRRRIEQAKPRFKADVALLELAVLGWIIFDVISRVT